jgi:putative ABC transport system permease protein
MLKSYLLIGFRNLQKHLSYSIINIVGLSLGLTTCLLLYIWINHELSYDQFHSKADQIYRGSMEYSFGGQIAKTSVSPTALLPALLTFPEIEAGVRIANPAGWNTFIVRHEDNLFQEDHFYFADSSFFKVFDFNLIKGNADKALNEPYSVIVTENAARKYFGSADPIGKVLQVNSREYTVTGLLQNIPDNSFLKFDLLASFNSLNAGRSEPIWWSANYQTFITLHKSASIAGLEEKINTLVKKELANELTGEGDYVKYNFIPLVDIHLRSGIESEFEVVGDIQYIYIFSAIALLVLIIAGTNYVNLATARAADRAKEVGLRKVVGAAQKQLFFQFIGESILLTMLSFIFGLLLAYTLLPLFNDLTGKNFDLSIFLQPSFILISLLVMVFIAFLAGAYPAFVMTSFRPSSVLKGNFKFSGKGIWLRKTLVVFQFGISIVLIVGTIVILQQLNFIQTKKLGYDKENTIILPLDKKTEEAYQSLRTELTRSGVASHVARGNESPVQVKGGYGIKTAESPDRGIIVTGLPVDENYIPALGLTLIAGRNFNKTDLDLVERDTLYGFIVNESALAALYIEKDKAVGTKVEVSPRKGEIIGVVSDFHFSSLHQNIGPLVMFPESNQFSKIFIKLAPGNTEETLLKAKSIYTGIITHRPFEYQFLDQQYEALYTAEHRMGTVFSVFATLAIVIACLGLLGLVSFSAAQKTKEIGIRKVLGATSSSIMVLITQDYVKLIILAIVLSTPAAYWIMNQWLHDFAYKVEIGFQPLAAAAFISVLIALIAASYQVIKASLLNPVETLRNE